MSSSFWWNTQDFNATVLVDVLPPVGLNADPANKLYLDSGNEGPGKDDVVETITVRSHLETFGMEIGKNLYYYLDNGGMHNEKYWGARFHVPMTDLYSPEPQKPTPA
jgi:hypothetical protein